MGRLLNRLERIRNEGNWMTALVLAAGLGTRLRPMTNSTPKCMLGIAGKPCLERIVDYLNNYGINEIIVNLHWLYPQIMQYFGNRLVYLYEPELLGTAGTVKRVFPWMSEDFLVLNGDTLNTLALQFFIEAMGDLKPYVGIGRTVSKQTGHNTGIYFINKEETKDWWPDKGMIDDVIAANDSAVFKTDKPYFDIGTPEKLDKARKYYENNSRLLP